VGGSKIFRLKEWINSATLNVDWSIRFDSLTLGMLVVVTLISALVHLYSIAYMKNDPHLPRFMSYLSLFTVFMIILVSANNFIQMFVGWEGVGLSSYLLINFWFTRIQANKAAIKAMLVNRVGDFFLLLAMFVMHTIYQSVDYDIILPVAGLGGKIRILSSFYSDIMFIDVICICIFLGAMGKSAQIILHSWLPDAMEGPTPVSALIHAATMVTAGVFLIVKCSFLFEHSEMCLKFMVNVGSVTALYGATTALFQNDIKKVIAYSTCSQLGYMILSCGLSSYQASMFHLSNHAYFKALLFLGAGSVIHAMADEQDMRKMGGLKKLLPLTYSVMTIGSLGLMGFPYLAGFYSKDAIIESALSLYNEYAGFASFLGLIAAFFTAFYSLRVLFLVFLSEPNGNKVSYLNAHEPTLPMSFPLVLLAVLTLLIGYLTRDLFIGAGTDYWGMTIFIKPFSHISSDIEFLSFELKILPFVASMSGALLALYVYIYKIDLYFKYKISEKSKKIFNFFNKKWYFDRIYNQYGVQSILKKAYSFFYQTIDRGMIEKYGPTGIYRSVEASKNVIRKIKSGFIIFYLMFCCASLFVFAVVSLGEYGGYVIFAISQLIMLVKFFEKMK